MLPISASISSGVLIVTVNDGSHAYALFAATPNIEIEDPAKIAATPAAANFLEAVQLIFLFDFEYFLLIIILSLQAGNNLAFVF